MDDPKSVEFLTELRLGFVDDDHFRLLVPFVCKVDDEKIVVPEDFVTDFDSVPKIPIAYLMLAGKGKRAAVLHDYLYSRLAPFDLKTRGRRWADRVFWRGMIDDGVPQEIADPKYAGVRLGGESHWEE